MIEGQYANLGLGQISGDEYAAKQAAVAIRVPRTVRENLDEKIARAQRMLAQLEATKSEMQKAGLLDMNIENLRTAMNY